MGGCRVPGPMICQLDDIHWLDVTKLEEREAFKNSFQSPVVPLRMLMYQQNMLGVKFYKRCKEKEAFIRPRAIWNICPEQPFNSWRFLVEPFGINPLWQQSMWICQKCIAHSSPAMVFNLLLTYDVAVHHGVGKGVWSGLTGCALSIQRRYQPLITARHLL